MTEPRHAFGPFVLDAGRGELLREGRTVALGHRALALLEALLEASGQPVSKSDLMGRAWPDTIVEEVNLTVQMAALRKALGTMPDGRDWIVTVPRLGYRLPRSGEPVAHPLERSGPASIAVLPFQNFGDDPEQDYFADGMIEDMITALSRFHSFAVVARPSSFAYKGRTVDVRQVARELGVRYVLEGSVRRRGDGLRVAVQLVEAVSGIHLWAESFDGRLQDVFDFQDRITENVVGLVEPRIRQAEIERARRKRPESLDAYDLFLRALPRFYGAGADGYNLAVELLEQAIALEPEFPMALAYGAWAHEKRYHLGGPDLHADRSRGLELAQAGLRAAGNDSQVLAISSFVLWLLTGDATAALEGATRAFRANPNNVVVLNAYATCHVAAGDLDEARRAFLRVIELSPGAPEIHEAMSGVGAALLYDHKFAEAVPWLQRAMAGGIDWQPPYWYLAAALAHLARTEEAGEVIERMRRFAPGTNLKLVRAISTGDTRGALLIEGLRLAGLPED